MKNKPITVNYRGARGGGLWKSSLERLEALWRAGVSTVMYSKDKSPTTPSNSPRSQGPPAPSPDHTSGDS